MFYGVGAQGFNDLDEACIHRAETSEVALFNELAEVAVEDKGVEEMAQLADFGRIRRLCGEELLEVVFGELFARSNFGREAEDELEDFAEGGLAVGLVNLAQFFEVPELFGFLEEQLLEQRLGFRPVFGGDGLLEVFVRIDGLDDLLGEALFEHLTVHLHAVEADGIGD